MVINTECMLYNVFQKNKEEQRVKCLGKERASVKYKRVPRKVSSEGETHMDKSRVTFKGPATAGRGHSRTK